MKCLTVKRKRMFFAHLFTLSLVLLSWRLWLPSRFIFPSDFGRALAMTLVYEAVTVLVFLFALKTDADLLGALNRKLHEHGLDRPGAAVLITVGLACFCGVLALLCPVSYARNGFVALCLLVLLGRGRQEPCRHMLRWRMLNAVLAASLAKVFFGGFAGGFFVTFFTPSMI